MAADAVGAGVVFALFQVWVAAPAVERGGDAHLVARPRSRDRCRSIGAEVAAGIVRPPEAGPYPVRELLGHHVERGQAEAVTVGELHGVDPIALRILVAIA